MPVFINVNGHDPLGPATPQTQLRSINLAKRGCLAYLLEFLDMGQLADRGNRHNSLVQLDLCGTSGIAPFYLCLTRGLDVALAHPNADKSQSRGIGALWRWMADHYVGCARQPDHARESGSRVRQHGHANAIHPRHWRCRANPLRFLHRGRLHPSHSASWPRRPLLLTYNAKDECCFSPAGSLPPLEAAARPIYQLFRADGRFRTHINDEPGTHNFERDNREAFYQLVGDSFFPNDVKFNRVDISGLESELKTAEELAVPLPAGNATLHSLAVAASRSLPDRSTVPVNAPEADGWRSNVRERLRDVIHLERYHAAIEVGGYHQP